MKNLWINPELIKDNGTFIFKDVPSMYHGFTDVFYNGERIAILNGLSSPLQWTAKNGSDLPLEVIIQLEELVLDLMRKSTVR